MLIQLWRLNTGEGIVQLLYKKTELFNGRNYSSVNTTTALLLLLFFFFQIFSYFKYKHGLTTSISQVNQMDVIIWI